MNLLLDLQINNTVFQNVHQSFIKYIKHTEVINIHLFYKSKNTSFLKRTDLSQKGSFIRNKCFYSTFSKKCLYNKKRLCIFSLYLVQSIFITFVNINFLQYLVNVFRCFLCRPKNINNSFQTNIKYLNYKEYLNLLLLL